VPLLSTDSPADRRGDAVASDPEELQRSIERTRDELARTVDTIAERLDPKRAAKRGIGAIRHGVGEAVGGARSKLHLGGAENGSRPPQADPESAPTAPANGRPSGVRVEAPFAAVKSLQGKVAESALTRRVPRPVLGAGLAALLAFAAILVARRQRRATDD
jgi:Protein of unknown function (DUF3618)